MAEYSQKWHNGTSRTRSTKASNGLAAIQGQLNNLRREIKKLNEKVYAAQVGCELCKGPHYTKECPLKEEGKPLKKLDDEDIMIQDGKQGTSIKECNNRDRLGIRIRKETPKSESLSSGSESESSSDEKFVYSSSIFNYKLFQGVFPFFQIQQGTFYGCKVLPMHSGLTGIAHQGLFRLV
nr:hypothetical protein [Tanacetum cinerariifolium]